MFKQRETYKTTKGVENEGYEFEVAVLTFYSLQLCYNNEISDFKIATNDDHFHPFDDIVISISRKNVKETYSIQLKHVREKLSLNSSHFTKNGKMVLSKYFKFDFAKSDHVVLLTNGIITEELSVPGFTIRPKLSLSLVETMLDTSDEEGSHIYEIFDDDSTSTSNKVTFYTSQRSCHEIKALVIDKLKETFLVNDKNLKSVLQKFWEFFQTWKKGFFGSCKLDKQDIAMKIAETLLCDHIIVQKPKFGVTLEENVQLLQNLLNQYINITHESCQNEMEYLYQFDVEEDVILAWGKQHLIHINSDINLDNYYKKVAITLWWANKFPLPLKIDEDCKKMIYYLINSLQNEKLSFILIGENISKSDFKKANIFEHLEDLKDLEFTKKFELSLQGRTTILLKELIELSTRFLSIISLRELVLMAKENFIVGEPLEVLPEPYVPRHLLTTILKTESIQQNPNDLFLISGSQKQLETLKEKLSKRPYCSFENYEEIVRNDGLFLSKSVILSEQDIKNPSEVCEKIKNRNMHCLKIVDEEHLQWIYSKEKTENIWKHRIVLHENQLHDRLKSSVNLVCARPGMGKLTLLRYLKNSCPSGYWTVRYNFREPQDDKKDYFVSKMQKCFEETSRVIYFFYGIDYDKLEKTVKYIQKVSEKGFKVWIFSEDHLRENLENQLGVVSMDIQEFDENQQQDYIRDRLRVKQIDQGLEEILMSFKMLRNNDILGAPMHLYMLTEIFITNPTKKMEEFFILTDIYKYFMNIKYNQYLCKSNCNQNLIVKDGIHYRTEQYMLAAMRSKFIEISSPYLQSDAYFLRQIRSTGDILGIIFKINPDDIVVFTQHTYGDYFAAQWLATNFCKIEKLSSFIFKEEFKNILFMFNLELSKHNPAHVAVLYQNYDQLEKHKEKLNELDQVRRTPLHIACSYGIKYPKLEMTREEDTYRFNIKMTLKEDTEVIKIIDYLTEAEFNPLRTDRLFEWNMFDYACITRNLYAVEKLLTKVFSVDTLPKLDIGDYIYSALYYSVKFGYKNLLHLIVKERLLSTTLTKINLSRLYYNGETLLHLAVKSGNYDVVCILLDGGIETDTLTSTYYKRSALHLAVENGHFNITHLLLQKGAYIDIMDRTRCTPLHISADKGDFRTTELLVQSEADVNFSDNFGRAALHRASSGGHIDILSLLLKNKAKINQLDKLGKSPLIYAKSPKIQKFLQSQGAEPVKNIIKLRRRKSSVRGDYDSYTKFPLHWAAIIGQTENVGRLLKEGWCIDDLDNLGRSPLHWALIKGSDDMAQLLIEKGAKVNIPDNISITPLFWAINNGNPKLVELLIQKKAIINIRDSFDYTPLHWGAMQENDEIVRLLLKNNNCELEALDHLGMKPIDWAIEMGNYKPAALLGGNELARAANDKYTFLKQYERISEDINKSSNLSSFQEAVQSGTKSLIKKFLQNGINVDEVDQLGYTALFRAVVKQNKETVLLLLDNKANINATNQFNSTPLHWVAYNGNLEILQLLLKNQPDVNAVDGFGYSSLHIAAMKGLYKTTSLLLEAGANSDVVDVTGNTPLDCACKRGHVKTVGVLLKNGVTAKTVQRDCLNVAKRQHIFFNKGNDVFCTN